MTMVRNDPAPVLSRPRPTRSSRLRIGVVAPAWLPVPPIGYGGTERVVAVPIGGSGSGGGG